MWKNLFLEILKSFTYDEVDQHDSGEFKRLIVSHGINRRKNARVNYPPENILGPFPEITLHSRSLNIINISVGGLLVSDPDNNLGFEVGQIFKINMIWSDFSTSMKAKVVGVVLNKRHIQFIDFNAPAFVRISDLVKPGFLGQKFYKVDNFNGQLDALEMWIGPTNDTLIFLDNQILAEYNTNKVKILFPANEPPEFAVGSRRLESKDLKDLFVQISNFRNPSPRVLKLIHYLNKWLNVDIAKSGSSRTGTDG
jgi:hypothetical protein